MLRDHQHKVHAHHYYFRPQVLVFSTWVDVLELVGHALRANRLPYAYARQAKHFDSELRRFRCKC